MWRKEKNMYMCVHTQKKEKRGKRKRKGRKEERESKREKNPRQFKKDIVRDDNLSEDQEKCEEGCDDVENESSIFHTMCNPTSRTPLVP
jgi:hypothetical protein